MIFRTTILAAAVLFAFGRCSLAQVMFHDVSTTAGVTYQQHGNFGQNIDLLQYGSLSGGVALGDYDGDGWIDIFATRLQNAPILFHNEQDGTFSNATAGSGITTPFHTNGAAWVDIENDGDLDLMVTTLLAPKYYLWVNDGAGNFTEEGAARGVALFAAQNHYGFSVGVGDYDRDGYVDLFLGEWLNDETPNFCRLLRNLGSASPGFFEDVTDAAGVRCDQESPAITFSWSPGFADLDNDGWQDLTLAGDFGFSRMFWNQGDGTFMEGTVAAGMGGDENGMGSAIGDYDNDGHLDWFISSIRSIEPANSIGEFGNRLYRNEGHRQFTDRTDQAGVSSDELDYHWGWGSAFFDYDNDGDLDLVVTNGVDLGSFSVDDYIDDPMRFYENNGDGTFTERSTDVGLTDTSAGKGLAIFDYQRDGDLDIFIVRNGDLGGLLYENNGGNQNGWLRVDVRGTQSNRDGYGARVYLQAVANGPVQMREIGASTHFLGQSEQTAHFGLGPLPSNVHRVWVDWPASGETQELTDIGPNATVQFIEPTL